MGTMNNKFKKSGYRIVGNFMTAFFSPLMGTTIAFNLDTLDINQKILLTALISASIVTGLVISRELQRMGGE